ncbi:NTE family protein [Pelagirhabdus alkalitolerans]|uniref:NTE family protein n=1 Tax=Pelagirhabdus alkalitolerans TaxID=1612202 RepID=A0A1G6HZM8_9BACI|nr:patatin-like phospholipase family protein [Pelagirhabdus alkalitolerans]SDB99671.1 NTE family protein [Pelagirhabdus alkalitolerans]
MQIDVVFSGGGARGFAYIGVLQAIESKNFTIKSSIGSSVGAIMAGLIACDYTSTELYDLFIRLDITRLLKDKEPPSFLAWFKWLKLYYCLGLYNTDPLENILTELCAKKGYHTFGQLEKGKLCVTAVDLTLGKLIVIPDDLETYYGINPDLFSIAKALTMSASLPYFFKPYRLKTAKGKTHLIVDGGLVSNLPMWLKEEQSNRLKRPLVGFQLQSKENYFHQPKLDNGINYTKVLLKTMQDAQDVRYLLANQTRHVVYLNTDFIKTIHFQISKKERLQLIELGRKRTESYLNKL